MRRPVVALSVAALAVMGAGYGLLFSGEPVPSQVASSGGERTDALASGGPNAQKTATPQRPDAGPHRGGSASRPTVPAFVRPDARPLTDAQREDEAAGLIHRFDLPDGSRAALYPMRASYPRGTGAEVRLELAGPDGKPIEGRGDIEGLLRPIVGGAAQKIGFAEVADEPGSYRALFRPESDQSEGYDVIAMVSETGDPNRPGRVTVGRVSFLYGGCARLGAQAGATARAEGSDLLVDIPVISTSDACRVSLVAELRAEGLEPVVVSAESPLSEGPSALSLSLAGGAALAGQRAWLVNMTLFVEVGDESRAVDLWTRPLPLPAVTQDSP